MTLSLAVYVFVCVEWVDTFSFLQFIVCIKIWPEK